MFECNHSSCKAEDAQSLLVRCKAKGSGQRIFNTPKAQVRAKSKEVTCWQTDLCSTLRLVLEINSSSACSQDAARTHHGALGMWLSLQLSPQTRHPAGSQSICHKISIAPCMLITQQSWLWTLLTRTSWVFKSLPTLARL